MARLFYLHPLAYSFIAGITVSLACNIYTSFQFSEKPQLGAWSATAIVGLQILSGSLFFGLSLKLDEVRSEQMSLKSLPDPRDLEMLLSKDENATPLKRWLVAAVGAFAASILVMYWH